ncbi:MAG: 16S rRNA processing protein RimM [Solirubrobacterales bacterium]|nr:16S rRNA processing protein RimM [Solirubrobacterales bacterium]
MTDWLRAGTVGRPHGLDGSFHVMRPSPELLVAVEEVVIDGRARRIARRSGTAQKPIVRLEGCEDRSEAQRLGGSDLLVSRELAPELGPDEWWAEDLVGCEVRQGSKSVGIVGRLLGLPSCEVLEVSRADQPELLVPLVSDAVTEVDLSRQVIEVDLGFLGE